MNRILSILLVLALLISGCSNKVSKPKDIRSELYNDTVEVLNLYTDFVENGKGSFNEISRKWLFYSNKYSQTDNLTDLERDLLLSVSLFSLKIERYNNAIRTDDYNDIKKQLNLFNTDKEDIQKMLNLK